MGEGSRLNVDRLMRVLSSIFSDKYGVEVTMTARRKEEARTEA